MNYVKVYFKDTVDMDYAKNYLIFLNENLPNDDIIMPIFPQYIEDIVIIGSEKDKEVVEIQAPDPSDNRIFQEGIKDYHSTAYPSWLQDSYIFNGEIPSITYSSSTSDVNRGEWI